MCPSGQWMDSRPLVRVQKFGARWCASIVSLPSLARRPSPFPRAPLSRTHNITPDIRPNAHTAHHAPRQAPRSQAGMGPACACSCSITELRSLHPPPDPPAPGSGQAGWLESGGPGRSHMSGQSVNASQLLSGPKPSPRVPGAPRSAATPPCFPGAEIRSSQVSRSAPSSLLKGLALACLGSGQLVRSLWPAGLLPRLPILHVRFSFRLSHHHRSPVVLLLLPFLS